MAFPARRRGRGYRGDRSDGLKLGTLKNSQKRDGDLVVVSRDNRRAVRASHISMSLREAIESWTTSRPLLEQLFNELEAGRRTDAFEVDEVEFHSPMPRSFQWADGSAFLHHVKLVRLARKAPATSIAMLDVASAAGVEVAVGEISEVTTP